MIEPSPPPTESPKPEPPKQSFGLLRLLLCFVAFGAVASLARNVAANLVLPALAGGLGCALLVISIRRRYLPLAASMATYASIGLLLGSLACDSYYGPAVGQVVTISSVSVVVGLILLILSRRSARGILLQATCASVGAALVVLLISSALPGDPLVLIVGPVGSLVGWLAACLPAETVGVERTPPVKGPASRDDASTK